MLPLDPQYEVSRRKGEAQDLGPQYLVTASVNPLRRRGVWRALASVVGATRSRHSQAETRGEEAAPVVGVT